MNWQMHRELEDEYNVRYDYVQEAFAADLRDLELEADMELEQNRQDWEENWRHMESGNLHYARQEAHRPGVQALCLFCQRLTSDDIPF